MKIALALLLAAALAAGPIACGEDDPRAPARKPAAGSGAAAGSSTSPAASARADVSRSALARNAAEANRFVGEGRRGLLRRLAELKGHPVVVNLWASWCGPCRLEFPFFAAAAERHAARVAFVGIDVLDSRDLAESFVDEQPPGFPSIYDDDGKAARSLGGGRAMPTTFFLKRDGSVAHTKLGGYAKAAELEADIRRYALGAS